MIDASAQHDMIGVVRTEHDGAIALSPRLGKDVGSLMCRPKTLIAMHHEAGFIPRKTIPVAGLVDQPRHGRERVDRGRSSVVERPSRFMKRSQILERGPRRAIVECDSGGKRVQYDDEYVSQLVALVMVPLVIAAGRT